MIGDRTMAFGSNLALLDQLYRTRTGLYLEIRSFPVRKEILDAFQLFWYGVPGNTFQREVFDPVRLVREPDRASGYPAVE